MKKDFIYDSQADKIYSHLLAEKQRKIKRLKNCNRRLKGGNAYLEAENDKMTAILYHAERFAQKQMATTRYVVLANFLLDTLAKTLEDDTTPMAEVIEKAIREYKRAMAKGMLLFEYDGENCVYAPKDDNNGKNTEEA